MPNKNCKVTDEEIISAMLSTTSQTQASKMLHITKQTLNKRLKNPELKTRLSKCRLDILDETSNRLLQANLLATEKLTGLLNSENDVAVYNSASKILQLSRDYVLSSDISARLEALEQETNNKK